ncbi:hypothetical protein [Pedobacter arcticus]|uniref:hypothetical protein n=1 Tax=Pedobacter arcticus TaxID=752140 RepID=UPI000300D498|nr:hypothetical protein [Pedobacter arcticus]
MTIIALLLMNNSFLKADLESKNILIGKLQQASDSTKNEYKLRIDSLAVLQNDNSYTTDGKKVTISDIIKSANSWYLEKESLKIQLENCLSLQKSFKDNLDETTNMYGVEVNKSNENLKVANNNAKIANSYQKLVKKYNPDKYREYEFFYQSAKKYFGLDYEIKELSDSTRNLIFKPNSTLDSALGYFEALKTGRGKKNIILKQEVKGK